jgi:hypothetical protein
MTIIYEEQNFTIFLLKMIYKIKNYRPTFNLKLLLSKKQGKTILKLPHN